MSVNFNRKEKEKCFTSKHYKTLYYDHDWDLGWNWKNNTNPNHKSREWKTWKYNRKTQYRG